MLKCNSLSVTYGEKIRALSDLTLHVEKGEVVALIGANGAGKSTFLKTVSGLHRTDSGQIFFEDKPIHEAGFSG